MTEFERLTKHLFPPTTRSNGIGCVHFDGRDCVEHEGQCTDDCPWEEAAWARLAAYEDSGLSPERVAELAKADAEGRVIVLPCKPGDTVYYLTGAPTLNASSRHDRVEATRCHGFYYGSIGEEGLQIGLKNYKGNHGNFGAYGKTIFLTREEAQAVLERMRANERIR